MLIIVGTRNVIPCSSRGLNSTAISIKNNGEPTKIRYINIVLNLESHYIIS